MGRIPAVVVIGKHETHALMQLAQGLTALLGADDDQVAIVSSQRISFGFVRSKGHGLLMHQVETALADPVAVAIVVVVNVKEISKSGLGLDRCDVVVVTSGLTVSDARAVEAVARLAPIVVISPDSPSSITEVIKSVRLVKAATSDDSGLLAAVASVMRPPFMSEARQPSQIRAAF
jgi:hypothetical protein